jgi:hypothetical protein
MYIVVAEKEKTRKTLLQESFWFSNVSENRGRSVAQFGLQLSLFANSAQAIGLLPLAGLGVMRRFTKRAHETRLEAFSLEPLERLVKRLILADLYRNHELTSPSLLRYSKITNQLLI